MSEEEDPDRPTNEASASAGASKGAAFSDADDFDPALLDAIERAEQDSDEEEYGGGGVVAVRGAHTEEERPDDSVHVSAGATAIFEAAASEPTAESAEVEADEQGDRRADIAPETRTAEMRAGSPLDAPEAAEEAQAEPAAPEAVEQGAPASAEFSFDPIFFAQEKIDASAEDAPEGPFEIDAVSGAAPSAGDAVSDDDTEPSQTVALRSMDGAGAADQTENVEAPHVNSAPSDILFAGVAGGHGTAIGQSVAIASATDPEGDAVTFALLDDAGGKFAIDANSGAITLEAPGAGFFVPGGVQSASLTVSASDADGASTQEDIVIHHGSALGDVIAGGVGIDIIYGGGGADTIAGGAGDDVIDAGDGADLIIAAMGAGNDVIAGGAGMAWTDAIQLQDAGGGGAIGVYGVDWTVLLTTGTIDAVNANSIDFSNDSGGTISLSDGTEIAFQEIEQLVW